MNTQTNQPETNQPDVNQPAEENGKEEIIVGDKDAPAPHSLADEIAKLQDQLLRAIAENENLRKRTQREKEEALKFGTAQLARDVVGIVDNIQRALESVEGTELSDDISKSLLEGVALISKELDQLLKRHNITPINPKGQAFDPHCHQAVFEQETNEYAPGTVIQVIQVGYNLHDRLLRPAMVGVAKAVSTDSQA